MKFKENKFMLFYNNNKEVIINDKNDTNVDNYEYQIYKQCKIQYMSVSIGVEPQFAFASIQRILYLIE